MVHFSNQLPLKSALLWLPNIHTPTAVPTMHGDSSLRAVTVRLLAQGKTWHTARRSRGSNWQPSGNKSTRSTSWAPAAPLDILEDPSRVGWRFNCVASCCRSTIVIVDATQVQISAFHSLRNSSVVSNSNRLMKPNEPFELHSLMDC